MTLREQYEDAKRRYSRRSLFRGGAALATTVPLREQAAAGGALRPFGRHLAFGADPTLRRP